MPQNRCLISSSCLATLWIWEKQNLFFEHNASHLDNISGNLEIILIPLVNGVRDTGFRSAVTKLWAWAMGFSIERVGAQPRGKHITTGGPGWTQWGVVKASPAQIDPQMSRQVPSHQMSLLGPQLEDIQGVKHSYVQCMKGRYLSLSLHLRDAAAGLPFLFSGIQHFRHSSLDLKGV